MISPGARGILDRARFPVVLEAYRKELPVSELPRDYAKPVNLSGGQVQLGEMDEWLQEYAAKQEEYSARQSQRANWGLLLSIISICIAIASLCVAIARHWV
jgi:hypothetical protein